jgi:hypothetical protein
MIGQHSPKSHAEHHAADNATESDQRYDKRAHDLPPISDQQASSSCNVKQ